MNLSTFSQALAAAAFLSISFAGVAHARDIVTAQLQAPAGEARYVARSTVWTCESDTCRARPDHSVSVSACRALVRVTGPVAAYGSTEAQLTEEQLTACNASARVARNAQATQQAQN